MGDGQKLPGRRRVAGKVKLVVWVDFFELFRGFPGFPRVLERF